MMIKCPTATPIRRIAASRCVQTRCAPVQPEQRTSSSSALAGAIVTVAASLCLAGPSFADIPITTPPGTNLGYMSDEEVDLIREKFHFKRAHDGRVAIQNKVNDHWMDAKLDVSAPGTILLRDENGGVFYLAFKDLKQVDLSDDDIVTAISKDSWEMDAQAIEGQDERGRTEQLEMTREGFYQTLSIIGPMLQQ